MTSLAAIDGVKSKFHAGSYSQFFKHTEKIILDGVLAEAEAIGNLAVAQAFGHQPCNLLFAFAQGTRIRIGRGFHQARLDQCVEHELQLGGTRPDLAFVYAVNALAKRLKRIRPAEHSACSGAESFHHQVAIHVVEQDNHAQGGVEIANLTDQAK